MKPWKIQKFFGDLIYDMRSRGLLPLAGLLLAAMIAVPMYLASQGTEVAPQPAVPADQDALAPENQAAVVKYEPGVRDYKKRIADQTETDPFIQQFTVSDEATKSLEDSTGGAGGGTGTEALPDLGKDEGGTGGTGDTGGSGSGSGSGGSKPTTTGTRYYFYETDVFTGEAGTELKRINRVPNTSPLPSRQTPVLLYMGVTNGGKTAVFSVSSDVVGVGGEGFCSPSPESCQLLALEKGQQADLTYAFANKVYTLKVADIRLRITTKPPKRIKSDENEG
jgi:hypothetical protein